MMKNPMASLLSWEVARYLFAVIFVSAAVAKWLNFGEGVSPGTFEISPQLEWMAIQFEIVMGIWLFVGFAKSIAWWVTVCAFSVFAGTTFMMALEGRSSCGCLGTVNADPTVMLLADISLVCLLFFARPETSDSVQASSGFWGIRKSILPLLVASLGFCIGLFSLQLATPIASQLARTSPFLSTNKPVVCDTPVIDLGRGSVNELREIKIGMLNRGEESVTLVGMRSSCSQCSAHPIPLILEPDSRIEIVATIRLGNTPGRQHGNILFWTSSRVQPSVVVRWTAKVK